MGQSQRTESWRASLLKTPMGTGCTLGPSYPPHPAAAKEALPSHPLGVFGRQKSTGASTFLNRKAQGVAVNS